MKTERNHLPRPPHHAASRVSCASRTGLLLALSALAASRCSSSDAPTDAPRFTNGKGGQNDTSAAGGASGAGGEGGKLSISVDTSERGGSTGVAFGPDGCKGLVCQKPFCKGGGSTTISGKVYDPSGTLPLYNVMVYVPNAPLEPLTPGANCLCEVNGEPIASGLSDTTGHFVVTDAPAGTDIPLVVQVGKWRRQFTVPKVDECTDTAVPDGTLRLPRKQAEGDLPKVALTTGEADALECLIRKLGIDDSEITTPDGSGKFHFFAGHGGADRFASTMNGGAAFPPASSVWGNVDTLKPYDVVLLSCEGAEYPEEKGSDAFKAMGAYTTLGGRMFASHWHQVWLKSGPYPSIAQYTTQSDIGDITAKVVTSFPKGQALSEWLVEVKGSSTPGQIDLVNAQHTIVKENPMYAKAWLTAATSPLASVQYLSANTPVDVTSDKQCGRIVLSDLHVAGGVADGRGIDTSSPSYPFPTGCVTSSLTPQEKVLAFMLFDITACTIPDTKRPEAPPVR